MTNPRTHISFHFIEPFNLRERRKLKAFLKQLFEREARPLSDLSYVFCHDEYLLDLNRRFLHHDYYTDILTFPLSRGKSEPVSAEIYISLERVKDNALTLSTTFNRELHRVIFHGALHLCHYKDKTRGEKQKMRLREDYYLKKYLG